MKSENCDNLCSFILVLFVLAIILLCLRMYCLRKEQFEQFTNGPSISDELANPIVSRNLREDPCSPKNFKQSLYHFYKSAEKYRGLEKELHDSITKYEDTFNQYRKQQNHLEKQKETLHNCINF